MSDIPESPTAATRALIGWFVGALAFKCIETLDASYGTAFAYGLAAVVVAIFDYKLPAILADNPGFARSLNRVSSDARWWIGIAVATILLIAASTFVAERRWPFMPPTFAGQLIPDGQAHSAESNLKDALINDLSAGTFRIAGDLTDRDNTSIYIVSFTNPHDGAQFLAAYIPMTDDTIGFIKEIINEHRQILKKLAPEKKAIQITSKGAYGAESTDRAVFTDRIFIYYEKFLTPEELQGISDTAKAAGVEVVLRSPAYLTR